MRNRTVVAILALGGCATTPVQPQERGRLARWDIQGNPDRLQTAMDKPIYFRKKSSSGVFVHGPRYSPIVDPRSGLPVDGFARVSVVGEQLPHRRRRSDAGRPVWRRRGRR